MAATAIVTDSTCDMPLDWYAALGVAMVPLKIRFGDQEWLDWAELDPPSFYERLATARELPKTSQPSPAEFGIAYGLAAERGATDIVSIHLSGALSGTVASARIAADSSPIPVHVVDTHKVSAAIALAVLEACRVRDSGGTGEECAAAAQTASDSMRLFFMLDTLDYLVKGGRAGKAQGLAAALLNIKPILEVDSEGIVAPYRRSRGEKQALAELIETVEDDARRLGHLNVAIVHANHPERAEEVAGAIRASGVPATIMLTSHVGAVIGTYAGPGAIGVAYFPAP